MGPNTREFHVLDLVVLHVNDGFLDEDQGVLQWVQVAIRHLHLAADCLPVAVKVRPEAAWYNDLVDASNGLKELAQDIIERSCELLLEFALVLRIDLLLGEVNFKLDFNSSVYLNQDEMMHCLTLVQWLRELEKDHHVISINFWKLKHLYDILVDNFVIVRLSMEFSIVLKHLESVLSSGHHQWEVLELCNKFSRGFSKSCAL